MVAVGEVVDGRYELVRLIARGGMGLVFEAVHSFTGRTVALKLLAEGPAARDAMLERVRREARALAALRHPNVVELFDAGENERSGPFLVMELVEGRPLDGILAARRKLAPFDAALVGRQVADALAFAHRRGVLHRDVKPTNVFVARDALGRERVKVIDFGIAWTQAALASPRLTQESELLGTPVYMAPEQLMGAGVDARSDVYGLGATLYECLTGAPPYAGTYPEVLVQVGRGERAKPVRALAPEVPEALAAAVERALAHRPEDRFPDAGVFASTLGVILGLEPDADAVVDSDPAARRGGFVRLDLLGPKVSAAPAAVVAAPRPLPSPSAAQRRRHVRAPYVTEALVLRADGTPIEGRTEDVSEGGVLVATTETCALGERVRVRFALPGSTQMLALDGVVRWARQARAKVLLGIELVEVTDEARAALAAAVGR